MHDQNKIQSNSDYWSVHNCLTICNPDLYSKFMILVMIEWDWTKTFCRLTRGNFAPNIQHLIYYIKYLWRIGQHLIKQRLILYEIHRNINGPFPKHVNTWPFVMNCITCIKKFLMSKETLKIPFLMKWNVYEIFGRN